MMVPYQKHAQKETDLDVGSGQIQESSGFNLGSDYRNISNSKRKNNVNVAVEMRIDLSLVFPGAELALEGHLT